MPTTVTHIFIPLALGRTATDRKMPLRFWLLAIGCSVLADADVIGFRFGIRYGDFFGHRGFFHSLFFAFLISSAVVLLAFRKVGTFSRRWWLIWLFFFFVSASHGVLDAYTDGGLGIALFSPYDTTRYFSPWRPLHVSPIGVRGFFVFGGSEALVSEIIWIWLALIAALTVATTYRKMRRTGSYRCSEHRGDCGKTVWRRRRRDG